MILKAKERGKAPQLANYLLTLRDNDHVELHEVRGFISDDLVEAFQEADAIARGTRCENNMFSMSLSPPEDAHVSTEDFEKAIDQIEEKLGLKDQPRAIVFHEKNGRRHAHAVWSRIDSERMRAINLPHYKTKLRDVSRAIFLEHGWDMPRGLEDRRYRDPLSFTRAEWEQARRANLDPRELKTVIQKAWETSDNRASFQQALKERGFWLAQGDRRAFVAVDYRGGVYAITRQTNLRVKAVKEKLGDSDDLPSVDATKAEIARGMTKKLETYIKEVERDAQHRKAFTEFRKADLVGRHRDERKQLSDKQTQRWEAETRQRASRLPKGFSGLWHRVTGRYGKIKAQNEREALEGVRRDNAEKDALIVRQLNERRSLQRDIKIQYEAAQEELMQLRQEVMSYLDRDRSDASRDNDHTIDIDHDQRDHNQNTRTRRGRSFEP